MKALLHILLTSGDQVNITIDEGSFEQLFTNMIDLYSGEIEYFATETEDGVYIECERNEDNNNKSEEDKG
jgi:hypothetical protein